MNAGKLRHRITILHPISTQTDTGAVEHCWDDDACIVTTAWAAINPLNAHTQEVGKSFADTVSHQVIIRYQFENIKSHYRVKFGVRIFNIDGIICPMEGKRELQLFCSELV